MKRTLQIESNPCSSTTHTDAHSAPKIRKKSSKRSKKRKDALLKNYLEELKRMDPTFPDKEVRKNVQTMSATFIKSTLEELDMADRLDLSDITQEEATIDAVSGIIKEELNKPVREMLARYPLHFLALVEIVKNRRALEGGDRHAASEPASLASELRAMPPPVQNEAPFDEYVDYLNEMSSRIVKSVVGLVENRNLVQSKNRMVNTFINYTNKHANIKRVICQNVANFVFTFAGQHLYNFFIDDKALIVKSVDSALRSR
uniref:Wsv310-like protein n=1 Tax=Sicyonia whispovirus TaxID=2984283 RepID=A0A9C7BWZ5_9VIRU|nr:MAG: wsv310-like protein [Sicyonia whispovirus]